MEYEVRHDYLFLHAEGTVDTYQKFLMGTNWMYSIIEKTSSTKVLWDYRKVQFKLEQTEAFNIIRIYEQSMPLMANVKLAAVVKPGNKSLAEIWEEIGTRRGYDFGVFTDFSKAESWLTTP